MLIPRFARAAFPKSHDATAPPYRTLTSAGLGERRLKVGFWDSGKLLPAGGLVATDAKVGGWLLWLETSHRPRRVFWGSATLRLLHLSKHLTGAVNHDTWVVSEAVAPRVDRTG